MGATADKTQLLFHTCVPNAHSIPGCVNGQHFYGVLALTFPEAKLLRRLTGLFDFKKNTDRLNKSDDAGEINSRRRWGSGLCVGRQRENTKQDDGKSLPEHTEEIVIPHNP